MLSLESVSKFAKSLKGKLLGAFLLIALLPLLLVSLVSYNQASGALEDSASDKLIAVRDVKAHEVEGYFSAIRSQIKTLSADRAVIDAMRAFTAGFQTLPSELNVDSQEFARWGNTVSGYYRSEFLPRLNESMGSSKSISGYMPSQEVVILAQHEYIAANPNPVGSKELLDFADNGTAYSDAHRKYHPMVRQFLNEFGYYDIFMIEPESGHIVYSVFKEADYATSLFNGPYRNTNFADVVRSALSASDPDFASLIDYKSYDPSYGAAAAFTASPIYDNGELIGALAFQMPIDNINEIMQQRSGLGDSGETYLVGSDLLMRSDSRFSDESTILSRTVDTDPVAAAASGKVGVVTADDYRDVSVRSAFRPIDIEGVDWLLLAEIDSAEINAPMKSILKTTIVMFFVITLVVIVAALIFSGRIVAPIIKIGETVLHLSRTVLPDLARVTRSVADGDLTQRSDVQVEELDIRSSDEIGTMARGFNAMIVEIRSTGDSLNDMVTSLRDFLGTATKNANDVAGASDQLMSASEQASQATQNIATTSQQLASGAESQARTVEETSGSLNELTGAIDTIMAGSKSQLESVRSAQQIVTQVASASDAVAASAQTAAKGSREAAEAAEAGAIVVRNTVSGLGEIKEAVNEVGVKVSDLGVRSAEIGNIVGVIDDIAAQTNLLALNAAIEAARAGEQGRGFAVVADEVRSLAERVTAATKEIGKLIEGVQHSVDESVAATEHGAQKVDDGVKLADEAGEGLVAILQSVTDVATQIEQISAAAEQVSASSDEMIRTVEQVQSVAEESASTADQMSVNSEQVSAGMNSVEAITSDSAAAAQEVSASAEEMSAQVEEVTASAQSLNDMAGELKTAVGRFKLVAE
jgi:methyl-accepting chemotaxis protein